MKKAPGNCPLSSSLPIDAAADLVVDVIDMKVGGSADVYLYLHEMRGSWVGGSSRPDSYRWIYVEYRGDSYPDYS